MQLFVLNFLKREGFPLAKTSEVRDWQSYLKYLIDSEVQDMTHENYISFMEWRELGRPKECSEEISERIKWELS